MRGPTMQEIEAARAQVAAASAKPRSQRAAKAREHLTKLVHLRLREEIRAAKRRER